MKTLRYGVLIQFLAVFLSLPVAAEPQGFTLNQLTGFAMEHNPQIDAALEQCIQGKGLYTQARAGYLPRVALVGDAGQQYVKDLQPKDEDSIAHGGIALSQLIYDFGRTTGAIDASRFSLMASQANLQQYTQDVVFALRSAYYRVLEKQRLIDVANMAVGNYEQHLHRARRYFDAGVRTRIDVTNAQVSLSNARLDLIRAESDLKVARTQLERVLGMQPNAGMYRLVDEEGSLTELASSTPPMVQSAETLLSTAFANRADMRQVQYLSEAGQADIRRARGGYFPSIGAVAGYDSYQTDLPAFQDQWNVGIGLTWEIFSGFATEGKVVEAKARYRELLAVLTDLEQRITSEVTDSYLRAVEYREALDLADETRVLAEENLKLAEGRYAAGLGDMLEFMDAQLSLIQAQSDLVTTYYAYRTAQARIESAVGVTSGLIVEEEKNGQCRPLQWHPE